MSGSPSAPTTGAFGLVSTRSADHRTDIWAIAITLYELLTMSLPFAAANPTQVCQRILSDDPTPLRKIAPELPAGLEAVLRRCLRRRPAERYDNVADLATDLAPFGPDHASHMVSAIYDFVEPTEQQTMQIGPEEYEQATGEIARALQDTGRNTTLYLDKGDQQAATSKLLIAAIALTTFGIGVGVGLLVGPPGPAQAPGLRATTPPAAEPAISPNSVIAPAQAAKVSAGAARNTKAGDNLVEDLTPAPTTAANSPPSTRFRTALPPPPALPAPPPAPTPEREPAPPPEPEQPPPPENKQAPTVKDVEW